MSGFRHDIAGGGGDLIATSVQSPDYAAGSAGWQIRKDGSAEFNNLEIRGTFNGTDFIVNTSGMFFYAGTPAAGNLILAFAPASGTDPFGNAYSQGVTIDGALNWDAHAGTSLIASNTSNGLLLESATGIICTRPNLGTVDPSNPANNETWHPVTPPTINGTTTGTLRYKLTAENEVYLQADLSFTALAAQTSVNLFTLPAAYIPAVVAPDFPIRVYTATAPTNLEYVGGITAAGVVFVNNLPAGTNRFDFVQRLPLD